MSESRGTGGLSRRELLKTGAAVIAAYGIPSPAWARFREEMAAGRYQTRFFTEDELPTVRLLADMVIPRDERSGSATEAGTIEYADFVLSESGERTRQAWRDGLRWLDEECGRRFGRRFTACGEAERSRLLDDIAWPSHARPEFRTAAEWFTRVRDLIGSGFFSSRMGVEDLGYVGNVYLLEWHGAPDAALRELGVSYAEWDRRYGGRR